MGHEKKNWNRKNYQKITSFISSNKYSKKRKVAVFDWDNTVIKNDIGDALFFHMIDHGLFKDPGSFRKTSRFLTDYAVKRIDNLCEKSVEHGVIRTDKNLACADEMISIYKYYITRDGQKAFTGFNEHLFEPAYAWMGQLLHGYSVEEVKDICKDLIAKQLQNPVGSKRSVASYDNIDNYVRFYDEMVLLINKLEDSGFEVWIVSASPQYLVETFAYLIGKDDGQIIGIRNVEEDGILTVDLKGCGSIKNGENRMITYKDGKRCWINSEIFGIIGDAALKSAPPEKRPIFGAGDSDTDISFVRDVTGLKIVINRNKPEITKAAKENKDGNWLLQDMFF